MTTTRPDDRHLGSWDAAFIGVGAMVGAGIFALLGAAGEVAGSAVWLSFLLAGGVAGLQGYSFAKFGARYPSAGGLLEYVVAGLRRRPRPGVIAWLVLAANAIVTGMVAVSFGSYASSVFTDDGTGTKLFAVAGHRRDDRAQHRRVGGRRPSPDRRGHRRHRHPRGVPGRHHLQPGPRPARPAGLPAVPGHRGERRADVLRLPRLRRDHVHRQGPRRAPSASCRGPMASRSAWRPSSTSPSRSVCSAR